MEYEKGDIFRTIDGVWMVVIDDNGEYEVAEMQKDDRFMYYVFHELEEMVDKDKITRLGKVDKDIFDALSSHTDGVSVGKIAKFSGYHPDKLRNNPEELLE